MTTLYIHANTGEIKKVRGPRISPRVKHRGTNCLIVPGLLVGGRLEKNLENFEIGKNVIKQATEQGYRGNSKQLAIGIVYNAGTIDEFAAFIRENPEVGVYEGNSIK
jgi:hypothetical protein